MKELFPDWRAQGVTACLHEFQGGFAFNQDSVDGLAAKARGQGRRDPHGRRGDRARVRGRTMPSRRSRPNQGRIEVGEQLVIAPGPWAKSFWRMLGLPMEIDIRTPSGEVVKDQPMWTYWNLQEGEITVDPLMFATADGSAPPVIHLDTDAPLVADDGELITDELWGIYFKRDRHGVQGGAAPLVVDGRCRARPVSVHDRRRPRLRGHVVRGALALHEPLRGLPPALQAGALRRRRSVHRGQLPGVRLHEAERLHDPRLEPRLQDDRGRARGREGGASASTRACSTRSGSSASRPATCTRSRTRRTPGARRPARPGGGEEASVRSAARARSNAVTRRSATSTRRDDARQDEQPERVGAARPRTPSPSPLLERPRGSRAGPRPSAACWKFLISGPRKRRLTSSALPFCSAR